MFGLLGGFQTYIMIGLGVALAAAVAFVYFQNWSHEQTLVKKDQLINELTAKFAAEKIAHAVTTETLVVTQEVTAVIRIQREILEKRLHQAEKEKIALQAKFDRHDLPALSVKKPLLIEKKINNASEAVRKNLEDITDPETYFDDE